MKIWVREWSYWIGISQLMDWMGLVHFVLVLEITFVAKCKIRNEMFYEYGP